MSAPGAPPETGYLEAVPDEGAAQLPQGPVPQGPPDLFGGGGLDDRYPASGAPMVPVPTQESLSQTQTEPDVGPQQSQAKVRSALFNPTPIEEMQPRLQRRDQGPLPAALMKPETLANKPAPLSGGVPDEPQTINTKLNTAVDRAIGMEGMHERVNQRDIQQYLASGGAGMDPAKVAWCAAFVNATLKIAGGEGSGSQVATSFLNWGEQATGRLQKGDVVVRPQGKGPNETGGHVGMATGKVRAGQGGLEIEMLSGNEGNKVSRTWEPLGNIQVRRMLGTSGGQGQTTKVKPVGMTTDATAPMTLEQQASGGFVPYGAPAQPAEVPAPVHPTTGKPILKNADGSVSTEKTITVTDDSGKFYNIPTIINGKRLASKEAAGLWTKGKNPPVEGPFNTLPEAITAAKSRSSRLGTALPPTTATPQTEAAIVTKTKESPATELDRLSQTKPWAVPNTGPAKFEPYQSPFPMTAAIPSQSFELPEELDPTQKQGDPVEQLQSLAAPQWGEGQQFRDIKDELAPQWGEDIFEPPTVGPQSLREPTPPEQNFSPAQYSYQSPPKELPKDFDIMTEPMPVSPEPATDNQKLINSLETIIRPSQQFVKGGLGMGGALVYGIPHALTGLAAAGYRKVAGPSKEPILAERAHSFFGDLLKSSQSGSQILSGLSVEPTPRNAIEKLAEIGGESVTPWKGATGVASMATYGVNVLARPDSPLNVFNWYFSDANAAPAKKPKEEKASGTVPVFEPAVPGHVAPGNLDVGALATELNATKFVQEDGSVVLVPNASVFGRPNQPNAPFTLPPELAIKQYNRTGANFGKFDSEEAADKYLEMLKGRVVKQINTVAGPAEVRVQDFAPMAIVLATTLGAGFAPTVIGRMTRGRMFNPTLGEAVPNAAPGTLAFSTKYELFRSYDDFTGTPARVSRRMGATEQAVKDMDELWSTTTRGAASNLASAAVDIGHAQTPAVRFKVNTSLTKLNNVVDEPFTQYVSTLQALEDIAAKERSIAASVAARPNQPAPGPPTHRGLDRAHYDNIRTNLEQTNPEVLVKAGVIRENNRELWRAEASGEYATITTAKRSELAAERPYGINYGNTDHAVANPATTLATDLEARFRYRLENEAKGFTIDEMNNHRPGSFVQVTEAQLAENPMWRENTVRIMRRGREEIYTTDPLLASAMRMNPYQAKSWATETLIKTRKGFEATTTGILAPWFAVTNFARSHGIIQQTAPTMGWVAPKIHQSLLAIPRQLTPKIKMALARSIDQQFGNWAGQNLGHLAQPWMKGLAARWEAQYKQSLDYRMQSSGAHYGTVLQQREATRSVLDSSLARATGPLRSFLKGWKATFEAVHNAPAYATARVNFGKVTREQLIHETRNITGNNQIAGVYKPGGKLTGFNRPEGYGSVHNLVDSAMVNGIHAYGAATELGRNFIPWFNVTTQGAKRIGRAWKDNPAKFTMAIFTTQQAPALAAFLWNRSLDKDPTGVSYVEYQMNHRSPYNTMLNHYIAIPGRPASEGIELPGKFHETAIFSRLFEIALDHMFRSNKYSFGKDFNYAAKQWVGIVNPVTSSAYHPVVNAFMGAKGIVGGQGPFEGDAYRRRQNPFDQNTGLPVNIELVARAFGGGIADILGGGMNAAIQAEGWDKPRAFVAEAGQKLAERTPILRNVMGMTPKQPGNTRLSEEMWARQGLFKSLDEFYRHYGTQGGERKFTNKPASKSGGEVVDAKLGPPPPPTSPGLGQPQTTNPLYQELMAEVHDKLTKDSDKTGGIGYRSMWQRYSRATAALKTLQPINAGNYVTWQAKLQEKPDIMEFLEQNNVNYKDPTAVKSFYEQIRQNAAALILQTVQEVEHNMSQKVGKPIKLEDLDPYKKKSLLPEWIHKNDYMEHLQGMLFSSTPDVPPGGYR